MQHSALLSSAFAAVLLVLCLPRILCAAGGDRLVFSWSPGDAEAVTAAGKVTMTRGKTARKLDCPAGGALWAGEGGLIGTGDVRLGPIPAQGTIGFWVRLSRRIQVCPKRERVAARIVHCEDLSIHLRENDNGVSVNVEGGNEIRRPRVRGLASFDLTHLRSGQWYHLAVRYDAPKGQWRLILNGVLQPEPWFFGPFRFRNLTKRIEFNGLMKPKAGKAKPARVAVGPITWRAGAAEAKDALKKLKAIKGWKIPPNRGEGVLEGGEDFDGEMAMAG